MTFKDPVCGMTVDCDQTSHTATYNNSIYYFCCGGCQQKFSANPEYYLNPPETTEMGPAPEGSIYVCPMDPEVRETAPGSCPICGMALEIEGVPDFKQQVEYTCPMHPEVLHDRAGSCKKCGMALEARNVLIEEENPELVDMTRRFWVSGCLALPVMILAMIADMAPHWLPQALTLTHAQWVEFFLAIPVVFWGGWPLLQRAWQSLISVNPNMFTLVGLGVGVAWSYSVVVLIWPQIFPQNMRRSTFT